MADPSQEAAGGITTAAAEWPAVEQLFGVRGEAARCWCRFFALPGASFAATPPADRKAQLKDKFDGGGPAPGVLAYRGGSAVGWCAVEPRGCYPRILRSRVFKAAGAAVTDAANRAEGVWSVTCFVVAPGWSVRLFPGAPLCGCRWDDADGPPHGRVRITGPSAVTATVCSLWAALRPLAERSVHSSSSW